MWKLSILLVVPVFLLLLLQKPVSAQLFPWSTGYYINLYGGGADLNGNIGDYGGEAACDISTGNCAARNRNTGQDYLEGNVQRYVCSGKVLNCDNTHAAGRVIRGPDYGKEVSIHEGDLGAVSCNQTVQLDVFDRMGGTLKGYMTWYSGDCPAQVVGGGVPTPTPTLTLTPTVTPQPLGGQSQTQTQTQTVSIQQPAVRLAQVYPTPTPAPAGKVKQLPATGMPAKAWFFLGAIPLGLALMGLRRRSSNQ